jgi:hypothetical protein
MADLTPAQLTTLATEINTDPKALGYAGKNNIQCAAILNTVGASAQNVGAGVVQAWQLMELVVQSEFIALTTANQNLFNCYVSSGAIDASNATVQANFLAIFTVAASPTTRANMVAFVNRSATRGEILFGSGTIIAASNVGQALNRAS